MRGRSPALGALVAVAALAVTTALLYPLEEIASPVSLGVLYLLAVLLIATVWGLWLALATSVAAAPDEKPVKGERIATAQAIPLRFLENILMQLRHAGLVESRRGADGGYRLARRPPRSRSPT